jgi:hypothetical protein
VLLHRQVRVALVKENVFADVVGLREALVEIAELKVNLLVDVARVAVLVIVWSFSYSTSIRFIASNAVSSSIAATAATGSPMKRTLSTQSACSS